MNYFKLMSVSDKLPVVLKSHYVTYMNKKIDVFLPVHHSINLFLFTNFMHNFFIL
jgi:hypothetical protein